MNSDWLLRRAMPAEPSASKSCPGGLVLPLRDIAWPTKICHDLLKNALWRRQHAVEPVPSASPNRCWSHQQRAMKLCLWLSQQVQYVYGFLVLPSLSVVRRPWTCWSEHFFLVGEEHFFRQPVLFIEYKRMVLSDWAKTWQVSKLEFWDSSAASL